MAEDDDIQIADIENYKTGGEATYNYQSLVMKSLMNCIEAGKHEMRTGWINERIDSSGNVVRTYVEDTRKRFIEAVKTSYNLLVREFDQEAKKKILEKFKKIKSKKRELLEAQWNWFQNLSPTPKQSWRGHIIKGFFNQDLGWYQAFVEYEVESYRKILIELMRLTSRRDDFKGEDFEA